MPTLLQIVVGVACTALGVLWIVWPIRMSRYQARVRLFGGSNIPEETDRLRLLGRTGGVVLTALGAGLALGLFDAL